MHIHTRIYAYMNTPITAITKQGEGLGDKYNQRVVAGYNANNMAPTRSDRFICIPFF